VRFRAALRGRETGTDTDWGEGAFSLQGKARTNGHTGMKGLRKVRLRKSLVEEKTAILLMRPESKKKKHGLLGGYREKVIFWGFGMGVPEKTRGDGKEVSDNEALYL